MKEHMGITDPEFTWHALRHTSATRLVSLGKDIRVIQVFFEEITKLSKQINHLGNEIFENKQKDTNNSIQLDVSTLKTEIQALKVEMSEVGDQLKKIENKFNVPNDLISKMLFNIPILGRLLRYLYT